LLFSLIALLQISIFVLFEHNILFEGFEQMAEGGGQFRVGFAYGSTQFLGFH
uniref:Rod shape-determining protein RodA n=1 Tax=Rodentolepis nana TaxID=102285 RepID=A0A0R3TKM0_RODNA